MIRTLLQILFGWPCDHDWETLRDGDPIQYCLTDYFKGTSTPVGNKKVWLYRCKKCCNSKTIAVDLN